PPGKHPKATKKPARGALFLTSKHPWRTVRGVTTTSATPVSIAVLTVSDTRTLATDTSGAYIVDQLVRAGHQVARRQIIADDLDAVREVFRALIDDDEVQVVISTGGTGITARD